MDHGEVVGRALLVAGGDAAELLQAVDQALDEIATPVRGTVEVRLPALVALARDHRPDVTPAQAAPCGRAAVALVARRTLRPQTGSAPTGATDRALIQQRLKRNLLVPLAAGQHRRNRSAVALGPQVPQPHSARPARRRPAPP